MMDQSSAANSSAGAYDENNNEALDMNMKKLSIVDTPESSRTPGGVVCDEESQKVDIVHAEEALLTPCYLITHEACLLHDVNDHPECPARLASILDLVKKERPGACELHDAQRVTREQLLRFHTADFIDELDDQFAACEEALASGKGETVIDLDEDTGVTPHTREAALRSCGAVCQAVDVVLAGTASKAFCAVRPPGHHAEPEQAMGFCYFNGVAVAARHALSYEGVERVTIVDFDVQYPPQIHVIFASLRLNPVLFCCCVPGRCITVTAHKPDLKAKTVRRSNTSRRISPRAFLGRARSLRKDTATTSSTCLSSLGLDPKNGARPGETPNYPIPAETRSRPLSIAVCVAGIQGSHSASNLCFQAPSPFDQCWF